MAKISKGAEILGVIFTLSTLKTEIGTLLKNQNRQKILKTLKRHGELNILELSKLINVSYTATYEHVTKLEKIGLIIRDKKDSSAGKPVIVRYIGEQQALLNKIPTGMSKEGVEDIKETFWPS